MSMHEPALPATRAITPDDVRWHAADAAPVSARCPVCGDAGPHRSLLDVPSLAPPHPQLTFARCGRCASGFYDPPGVHDFSDLGGLDDSFTRLYAEVGGGVWETIWPLLVASGGGSLLDVGCGYGFALDFWQQSGRGDAVGVELAEYGAAGAHALGVTIYRELLQDCEPLRGRRYDCVYASEVIEHVPSPAAFAALLAERVKDDGVLTMTTPAAEFIDRSHHGTTQLVALAPGFHGFLLSAAAFERALRDAGFAHVEVRRFHERQMAWASRRPLRLDFDQARMRGAYLEYLRKRTFTLPAASSIGLGYAYRLLRDEANTGAFDRARGAEVRIREGAAAAYGSGALEPDALAARYASAKSLHDLGSDAPFFATGYLHFAGALAQHVDHDVVRARAAYSAAADTARACAAIGPTQLPEAVSLYWPSLLADALLGIALGDDGPAHVLAAMADEGIEPSAKHGFAVVEPAQVEALLPSVSEQLIDRGRWEAAAIVGRAYARYVDRRYGSGTSSLAGMSELQDGRAMPADPVFAAYFEALGAWQRRDDEARGAVEAFVAAAEQVQGAHAARAAALAAKARAIAGMPRRTPAFSFEMSFTIKSS